MKGRTLLIFFILMVFAGLYLHYGVQEKQIKKEKQAEREAKIVRGDPEKLTRFTLKNKFGKTVVEKEKEHWKMIEPETALASDSKITAFIKNLQDLSRIRPLEKKSDLKEFGLNPAEFEIEIKLSDQTESQTLLFGQESPSKQGVYLWDKNKDRLMIASSELSHLKSQKTIDLREKRLLTTPPSLFSELEIKNKYGVVKFVRNDQDEWTLKSHPKFPLDQDFLQKQLEKIGYIRAIEFHPQKKLSKNPPLEVTVGFKENVRDVRSTQSDKHPFGAKIKIYKEVKAGKKSSSNGDDYLYFAQGDKTQPAKVARFHYDNFEIRPFEYVRKTFDDYKATEVQRINVEREPQSKQRVDPFTLERRSEQEFRMTGIENKAISQKNVESALQALLGLKALQFLGERAQAPRTDLMLHVQLIDQKTYEYRYFEKNSQLYIRTSGSKGPYLLYKLGEHALDPKIFDRERFLRSTDKEITKEPENESTDHNL